MPINPLSILANRLADKFNTDDLTQLCMDLSIDYENLSGSNKKAKARELVLHLERRDELEDLLALVEMYRPNVDFDWREGFPSAAPTPVVPPPSAPVPPPENKSAPPWFSYGDLLKIHELLITSSVSVDALLNGIQASFRAQLPTSGAKSARLLNILQTLNTTDKLISGDLPMGIFLMNAEYLLKPLPQSVEIGNYLKTLPG